MVTDEQFNDMARTFQELATSFTGAILQLRAADDALILLFARYAGHLGLSSQQIVDEFHQLYNSRHEQLLLQAEESDPSVAGLVDFRPIEGLEPDEPSPG